MMDISEARELLRHIPCGSLSYQEWTNVGAALHHEGLPCSLWDEWSASDGSRYHAGECERKWRTFGHYGGTDVTMGSIYHMAQDYGWSPADSIKTYGWDDMITSDDEKMTGWHHDDTVQDIPKVQGDYSPIRDITDYLSALFEPEEKVCIVTTASQDEDGKWRPYGGSASRTCKQLLDSLANHRDTPISDTFGTTNEESGVWVCFNPMDGSGRKNSSVTSFRYALVESDEQDIDTQYALLQDLTLRTEFLIHEQLFVGGHRGIDTVDGHTGGILAIDDTDGLGGILTQDGIFRTVHDSLGIEVAQTVGHNAQIIIGEAWNTLVVVFIELSDLFAHDFLIIYIIGLILLHQAVAFCLYGLVAFIDREIERCTQIIIDPGLAFFYFETGLGISWHQPDNDGGSGQDQC